MDLVGIVVSLGIDIKSAQTLAGSFATDAENLRLISSNFNHSKNVLHSSISIDPRKSLPRPN